MLPTKGYFQDIECPFYNNRCNRPYCHFRHRRKTQETVQESAVEETKESEVPTYKPTPKSELANIKSHIPISYVPDLAFRPDHTIRPIPKFSFEKPTYKPTPLSILSSANKPENNGNEKETKKNIETIEEIKQNIANVEYKPEVSLQDDINFEDLSAEFDLIDNIIQEPNDTTSNTICSKEEKLKRGKKIFSDVEGKKEKVLKDKSLKLEKNISSSSSISHKSKYHKDRNKPSNEEKHKCKEIKSSKHKERRKRSVDTGKYRSEKEKRKNKHYEKDRTSTTGSKIKDKVEINKKEKHSFVNKKKYIISSESSSDETENNDLLETNSIEDYCNVDFGDEDILTECYKIFNEYEPPKVQDNKLPSPNLVQGQQEMSASKKRIAHNSRHVSDNGLKIHYVKSKLQINPAQVMANRFKLAKLAQADNEQKNITNQVKQATVKRRECSLTETARNCKLLKMCANESPSTNISLVNNILNNSKNKLKKIAPVQNVSSIQRAKAHIDELVKQKATEILNKTPAQTIKRGNRVAHVPDVSLSDIPDVLNADKSKLPINVRTRFLTMIADECIKLYLTKQGAYNRALNEEFSCYEKCKVLVTYKNSAMLAVNRLRKELQEREKMGLGPIDDSESSNKDTSSDFKGKQFYNYVKQFILSPEELDLHGYPKESLIPGKAIIMNRKTRTDNTLGENQRRCSRCSKIYMVNEYGCILYKEECIYHPLKKRTLRGEQTYLCCKSNDEIGCLTSNTHVSESSSDCELEGFQTTLSPECENDPRSYAVYALDCEMCYTVKGLELTRVTIVDSDCKTVYESLVKPLNPIIDYNTTFSGITREQMERTSTGILQVQANILHLCNSKTILIGHSLESDMKALKIIHGTIIDTSVLFPHKLGLPHKRALRVLASEYLQKIIQNSVSGHDSAEDAVTCMELVRWKLKEELKVHGIK